MTENLAEEVHDWEEVIENVLKNIKITEADFKRKGATSEIHDRVLEGIEDEWNKSRSPSFEERAFQIDFVGRTFPRHGKVELAIEVDTWWKPTGNWVKLLDITARKKVWIYLGKEKEKAQKHFENAIKNFRKLAKLRREDNTNNVTIFMKVADEKIVRKRHLFE